MVTERVAMAPGPKSRQEELDGSRGAPSAQGAEGEEEWVEFGGWMNERVNQY